MIDMEHFVALAAFIMLFGAAGYFVWQPIRRLQSWNNDKHRD
jgi:F0F1-type ATP synthase membrane subunit b/b'